MVLINKINKINNLLIPIVVFVISLLGYYELAYSTPTSDVHEKYSNSGSSNHLSNDSIVLNIIDILKKGENLPKDKKSIIKRQIKSFPEKIIRRDTSSYYLQTVLKLVFNEFVTKDFHKAYEISKAFSKNVEEKNPLSLPIRFSLIKFTKSRLDEYKEREKNKAVIQENQSTIKKNLITLFIGIYRIERNIIRFS